VTERGRNNSTSVQPKDFKTESEHCRKVLANENFPQKKLDSDPYRNWRAASIALPKEYSISKLRSVPRIIQIADGDSSPFNGFKQWTSKVVSGLQGEIIETDLRNYVSDEEDMDISLKSAPAMFCRKMTTDAVNQVRNLN